MIEIDILKHIELKYKKGQIYKTYTTILPMMKLSSYFKFEYLLISIRAIYFKVRYLGMDIGW